ncbi:MAG: S8 family peptidase [Rhodospirillaceae bacterium]|nr:S8 family peptidase [Rhodospirillaceae bacterium]
MSLTRTFIVPAVVMSVAAPSATAQDNVAIPGKSPFAGQTSREGRIMPDMVVVKFKPEADVKNFLARDLATATANNLTAVPEQIGLRTFVLSLKPAFGVTATGSAEEAVSNTLEAVKAFKERPDVAAAEPVYIAEHFIVPNDALFPTQWHYMNYSTTAGPNQSRGGINLPKAWDITTGSSDVVVAVVDTGILPDEPEFKGSPNLASGATPGARGFDFITDPWMANDASTAVAGNTSSWDADPTDPGDAVPAFECGTWQYRAIPNSWHGSHVSGTVGAGKTNDGKGIAGVAWKVKVVPVRVLGRCGGTTPDIAKGILWAAGITVPGAAQNPNKADIINMSLGGAQPCTDVSATIQDAIDQATANGSIVIVAAGNDAKDAAGYFPASCKNVITVAANDQAGELVNRYSNFGSTIDVMAPGGDLGRDDNVDGAPDNIGVVSVIKGGYESYNGTSMAAPHVAGAVALLLAKRPDVRNLQGFDRFKAVEKMLKASAIPRTQTQCSSKPCGAGMLDIEALLKAPQ